GSEYTKLNVWLEPAPDDGVTDTFPGGSVIALVTVQVPSACHPENAFALLVTLMEMFLAPANDGLKMSAMLIVRLVPDAVTDDAPASSVHWLLFSVPAAPGVAEPV